MKGTARQKFDMWRDSGKGFKSRLSSEVHKSVQKRDDISEQVFQDRMDRGDFMQRARLKRYPSIDVEFDQLYAGTIPSDWDKATELLRQLGFRNNPTAYVEVTEEYGPDDGSYSKQVISEEGPATELPRLFNFPSPLRRVKRQFHLALYDTDEGVHVLAHEEKSAWLQPMRHVFVNDSDARIGVRDFRDLWYDNLGNELPGREDVVWSTAH